jgi:hypothetical protein
VDRTAVGRVWFKSVYLITVYAVLKNIFLGSTEVKACYYWHKL